MSFQPFALEAQQENYIEYKYKETASEMRVLAAHRAAQKCQELCAFFG